MPTFPPSRPSPDCLTPPKGAAGLDTRPVLRPTMPTSSSEENFMPLSRLSVNTYPTRPHSVSLARRRTSSSLSKGRDRSHRTEDLRTHQLGVQSHVHQHRGGVEIAGTFRACASGQDTCTLADGVSHEAFDLLQTFPVDEGSDVGTSQCAVAHLKFRHPLRELFGKFFDDGAVHEEAVCGGAGFAHVAHLGFQCAFDGFFDVCIGQDDEGGVPAEFHGGTHDVVCRLTQQRLAHLGGAGEADLAGHSVAHPVIDHAGGL